MNNDKFLKVAVLVKNKHQINILAAVQRKEIKDFMDELVTAAWETAKAQGLVTDAMLIEDKPAVPTAQDFALIAASVVSGPRRDGRR